MIQNAALATTKVSTVAQIISIEVSLLASCTIMFMLIMHDTMPPKKPMNLQEPSATEQYPPDETGIFFSPTTKLLSMVSSAVTMQT